MLLVILILSITSGILAQDTSSMVPPLFYGCDDPFISPKQRIACSVPKLMAYVAQELVYPDSAKKNNIEGLVVVSFVVNDSGKVKEVELIKDIGYGCGEEALRVVRSFPIFTPAKINGNAVAQKLTLPIRFKKTDEARADNSNLYQLIWGKLIEDPSVNDLYASIDEMLQVRDYYGNSYPIIRFNLKVVKKGRFKRLYAFSDHLTLEMKRQLKRIKKGMILIFEAYFEKKSSELKVVRKIRIK